MTWHQREKISSWFRWTFIAASSNFAGSGTFRPIFSRNGRCFEKRSNIIATPSVVRMWASQRRTYGCVAGMFLLL